MTWDELAALAAHPATRTSAFGMTPLALRTSGFANGVAALHGDTSRRMWRGLWPDLPVDEVPIHSVTNGIHTAQLAQPRDARAARPLHRPRPARAARGPDGVGARRHDPRRRALARARAAPRAPGAVRPRAPAGAAAAPGLAPHREPRRRSDALRPDAAHDLLRAAASRPTSARRCSSATPSGSRACSATTRRPVQLIVAGKAHPVDGPGKDAAARRRAGVPAPAPARPHRLPRGLRHARGALPRAGRRRLAQRAAPAARGLGHQRHEGRGQRRPQPVGARRVVGRGLLARRRLGDRQRRAVRGPGGERRASRPRRSTRCSSAR